MTGGSLHIREHHTRAVQPRKSTQWGSKTKSSALPGYIKVILDENHFEVATASNDFFIWKYTMIINNHVKTNSYNQVLSPNYYQMGISHPAQCGLGDRTPQGMQFLLPTKLWKYLFNFVKVYQSQKSLLVQYLGQSIRNWQI